MFGLPPAELKDNLIDIDPFAELPTDELLRAENAEEVLRRLEHTTYADMARHARSVYAEHHDLFDLEAALDRQYYMGLFDRFDALAERDRQPLAELIGAIADQMNLTWLLRYRFAFDLAPPHAYLLLIPRGQFLKSSHLLQLVQMESVGDVLHALPAPLNERLAKAASIIEVEKNMVRHTLHVAHRILRHTSFNFARALAYLVLRERQLFEVQIALKGRMLSLNEESIRIAASLPDAFLRRAATVSE
jgi:V/A-type H+-transporting ATPase subunit C